MSGLQGRTIVFVASADLDRARAFYVARLGLPLLHDDSFALELDLGDAHLRVVRVESFSPQPFTVLGWEVDDVHARLRELELPPLRYEGLEQDEAGVWESPAGALVAWFADPDGNVLSLTQR
jgi:catechol 2,3-dioxygenase-like lactoylglutathione lyase family enzyme